MTDVEAKTTLKRKHEDDANNDSEDELFFKHESETKKRLSKTNSEGNKIEEKENDKPKAAPALEKSKSQPESSSVAKGTPNKTMVQQKLSFFKKTTADSPKPANAETKPTANESEETETPVVKDGDEWEIQDFMHNKEWKSLLKDEFGKKYFSDINNFIREGYRKGINRPPKELVFNAFNSTKLSEIKVVIIGQDPYHDDGQAHGLAFSVPKGIGLPPSLRNIFIELKSDMAGEFERDEKLGGCLQKWTKEGVFLLNTFLTVEAHKPGSHSKIGWDTFTDAVIKLVSAKNDGCAFLLWGNFAQKKECLIDKNKHKIIKCAHPSPFSVKNFFGSKCFSKANDYLKSIGKAPINWSLKQ